uniref:Polycomb group protein RNA binding region domain-containing protein n=1 Tax=Sander lucioperca TaxID=283035 RepID=A0A8D0D3V6_SANLU
MQMHVPGRKRGRPPIRKLEFQSHYVEPLSPLKVPKKRGRKPGFKLKPRMVMSPLANSPPSSTPEPEMGSIPQDAAIVPHSATPQVLTEIHVFKHNPNMSFLIPFQSSRRAFLSCFGSEENQKFLILSQKKIHSHSF